MSNIIQPFDDDLKMIESFYLLYGKLQEIIKQYPPIKFTIDLPNGKVLIYDKIITGFFVDSTKKIYRLKKKINMDVDLYHQYKDIDWDVISFIDSQIEFNEHLTYFLVDSIKQLQTSPQE